MKPLPRETIAERIERLEALDRVSEPLQTAVRNAVPPQSDLKDLLSGTWLGHPLHPPLTDVVIGTWTSALLLDLLGDERTEAAADRLVAAGILAAIPTAAAGLSDWAELRGGSRRVGTVHALGNTTALVLHVASWTARMRDARGTGRALSAPGVVPCAVRPLSDAAGLPGRPWPERRSMCERTPPCPLRSLAGMPLRSPIRHATSDR